VKYLLVQNMLYRPAWGGANKATAALMEQLAVRNSCTLIAPGLGSYGPAIHGRLGRAGAGLRRFGLACHGGCADVCFETEFACMPLCRENNWEGISPSASAKLQPDWVLVAGEDPGQVCLHAVHEMAPDRMVYLWQTPWSLPFGKWSMDPNPRAARVLVRARFRNDQQVSS